MVWIKSFGKPIAAAFVAVGVLIIALSFIYFNAPSSVGIWLDGGSVPVSVNVDSPFAADWLMQAGIRLFPDDSMRYGGTRIPHDFKPSIQNGRYLSYKPAVPIIIQTDNETVKFYSGAETLGEALWEQNIFLKAADDLSLPMHTSLNGALTVSLRRSQPIRIVTAEGAFEVPSAARTVGSALADAGYPLEFLDYSVPSAGSPIPKNRKIRVVRVREEVITEETAIPFYEERVSDPQMNVGEEQVLQTGENGVQTATMRVRYEDGEETSRIVLSEWVSKVPVTQRIAYGGNIVEQTFNSPDGSVDYWLEMDVYITSYLDTGSPMANGIWPYYGAIAVSPDWYSILKGTSIYVPGYGVGTVMDVCPGCVGKPWIDVFIPTDQYVPWSRTETVYFLFPVPEGFSGALP